MALGARRTASGVEPVSTPPPPPLPSHLKIKTHRSHARRGGGWGRARARQGGCTNCMEILPSLRSVSDRFGPLIEVSCSAEQMAVSPSLVPPHYGGGQQDGTRW